MTTVRSAGGVSGSRNDGRETSKGEQIFGCFKSVRVLIGLSAPFVCMTSWANGKALKQNETDWQLIEYFKRLLSLLDHFSSPPDLVRS